MKVDLYQTIINFTCLHEQTYMQLDLTTLYPLPGVQS